MRIAEGDQVGGLCLCLEGLAWFSPKLTTRSGLDENHIDWIALEQGYRPAVEQRFGVLHRDRHAAPAAKLDAHAHDPDQSPVPMAYKEFDEAKTIKAEADNAGHKKQSPHEAGF